MYDAFLKEMAEYWPPEREFLALIAELLHTLIRVTAKGFGAKRDQPALRIPRPQEVESEGKPRLMSMREYVGQLKE